MRIFNSPKEQDQWLANAKDEHAQLRKRASKIKEEIDAIEAARRNKLPWWIKKLSGLDVRRKALKTELENIGCMLYNLDRDFMEYMNATGEKFNLYED
jgi:plasmid replication initiation protein